MENYINYANHIGADKHLQKWVNTVLKNELLREQKETEEVEHILDYMVQCGKKVERMSYKDANKLADAWTKTQQKKGNGIIEKPEDIEVVLDFKDGFKIVKLVGENAYKREGFLMSHCVGGYYGKGKEIYSLRDKENMPHCTMEKDQQIKGKGNGDIHPKYIKYIVTFLKKVGMTVGDSEMKHLGYINIENLLKELDIKLSKDTQSLLYQDKYYPIIKGVEGLKDKDNKQIKTLELFNYFPLLQKEETNNGFSFKLGFDISMIVKGFFELVWSKSKKMFNAHSATSGAYSHSATSGDGSHSATSGVHSNSATSGYGSHSATSGDDSHSATSGYGSHSATSGDDSNSATSGACSHSATSGSRSNSATSGAYSHSSTSGAYSHSATSGDDSNSATSGDGSRSATSGAYSHSATSGSRSNSATSGYGSHSATSGDDSHSATSGAYSHSATSGSRSNSATSGYGSHSSTSTTNSDAIACAIGRKAKAKATLGCFIVLAEWKEGKEFTDAKPIGVKSAKVDGKKIKSDTWYKLVDGKFIETDDSNE